MTSPTPVVVVTTPNAPGGDFGEVTVDGAEFVYGVLPDGSAVVLTPDGDKASVHVADAVQRHLDRVLRSCGA